MRLTIIFFFLMSQYTVTYCNENDSLLNVLEKSLEKSHIYLQEKENKLLALKEVFNKVNTPKEKYFVSK